MMCLLFAGAYAADDNPENRRKSAELMPPGAMESSVMKTLDLLQADIPPTKLAAIRSALASPEMKQRFDAATARYAKQMLRELSNEELARMHEVVRSKEHASVSRKMLMAFGDALPVIMDEVSLLAGKVSTRTKFEVEVPWQEIPSRRRALLGQAAPLLLEASGQSLPTKADMQKELASMLAGSGVNSERAREYLERCDNFDDLRLKNSIAESYARRLTTHEAEWLLANLQDPVYRSAYAKAGRAMEKTTKEVLPE